MKTHFTVLLLDFVLWVLEKMKDFYPSHKEGQKADLKDEVKVVLCYYYLYF